MALTQPCRLAGAGKGGCILTTGLATEGDQPRLCAGARRSFAAQGGVQMRSGGGALHERVGDVLLQVARLREQVVLHILNDGVCVHGMRPLRGCDSVLASLRRLPASELVQGTIGNVQDAMLVLRRVLRGLCMGVQGQGQGRTQGDSPAYGVPVGSKGTGT